MPDIEIKDLPTTALDGFALVEIGGALFRRPTSEFVDAELTTTVGDLSADVVQLFEDVSDIREDLEGKADASDIASAATLATVVEAVSDISADVVQLFEDVSQVREDLESGTGGADLEQALAGKASIQDLAAVVETVADVVADTTQLFDDVADVREDLEGKADVACVTTKLAELNTDVDDLQADMVQVFADIADLRENEDAGADERIDALEASQTRQDLAIDGVALSAVWEFGYYPFGPDRTVSFDVTIDGGAQTQVSFDTGDLVTTAQMVGFLATALPLGNLIQHVDPDTGAVSITSDLLVLTENPQLSVVRVETTTKGFGASIFVNNVASTGSDSAGIVAVYAFGSVQQPLRQALATLRSDLDYVIGAAGSAQASAVGAQTIADEAKTLVLNRTREFWQNGQIVQLGDYTDFVQAVEAIRQRTIWTGDTVNLVVPPSNEGSATSNRILSDMVLAGVDLRGLNVVGQSAELRSGTTTFTLAGGAAGAWEFTFPSTSAQNVRVGDFVTIRKASGGAYSASSNVAQLFGTWPVVASTSTTTRILVTSSKTGLATAANVPCTVRLLKSVISTNFGGPRFHGSGAFSVRDIVLRSTNVQQDFRNNVGITLAEGSAMRIRSADPQLGGILFSNAFRGLHIHGFTYGFRAFDAGTTFAGSLSVTGCNSHGVYLSADAHLTSYDIAAAGNGTADVNGCGFFCDNAAKGVIGTAEVPGVFNGNGNVGVLAGYGSDISVHWAEAYGNGIRAGNNFAASCFGNSVQRHYASQFKYDGLLGNTANTLDGQGSAIWKY